MESIGDWSLGTIIYDMTCSQAITRCIASLPKFLLQVIVNQQRIACQADLGSHWSIPTEHFSAKAYADVLVL